MTTRRPTIHAGPTTPGQEGETLSGRPRADRSRVWRLWASRKRDSTRPVAAWPCSGQSGGRHSLSAHGRLAAHHSGLRPRDGRRRGGVGARRGARRLADLTPVGGGSRWAAGACVGGRCAGPVPVPGRLTTTLRSAERRRGVSSQTRHCGWSACMTASG